MVESPSVVEVTDSLEFTDFLLTDVHGDKRRSRIIRSERAVSTDTAGPSVIGFNNGSACLRG